MHLTLVLIPLCFDNAGKNMDGCWPVVLALFGVLGYKQGNCQSKTETSAQQAVAQSGTGRNATDGCQSKLTNSRSASSEADAVRLWTKIAEVSPPPFFPSGSPAAVSASKLPMGRNSKGKFQSVGG